MRTVWVVFIAVIATIPLSLVSIALSAFKSLDGALQWVIRFWARCLVWAAGIDLRAVNVDVLDPKKRYILIANHYSYFDIPCVFAAIPQPIRFMAKVSLFKIPIFGWALARTGFIPIDRKNRSTAVKSFELAGERIRRGNTIVVFPEEGRSRERQMRQFQRGAFLLALRSELPIVPMAIDGTFDIMRAGTLRIKSGRVTITLTEPIETAGMSIRDREKLANEARARIEKLLFPTLSPTQPETERTYHPGK